MDIELILADATDATDSTNEKFRMELVLVGVIVLWLTNKWMVFHSDKKIHANIKSLHFLLSMVICNEFSAEDEQTDSNWFLLILQTAKVIVNIIQICRLNICSLLDMLMAKTLKDTRR